MPAPWHVRTIGLAFWLLATPWAVSSQAVHVPLDERDAFLPVSSIQWGSPDRWSFTSRYSHLLTRREDGLHLAWAVTLSPGTDGGRVSTGVWGLVTSPRYPDAGLPLELRTTLLRTWGHPLGAPADRTWAGLEARGGLLFLVVELGRYWPISSGDADPFWGLRFGIGL